MLNGSSLQRPFHTCFPLIRFLTGSFLVTSALSHKACTHTRTRAHTHTQIPCLSLFLLVSFSHLFIHSLTHVCRFHRHCVPSSSLHTLILLNDLCSHNTSQPSHSLISFDYLWCNIYRHIFQMYFLYQMVFVVQHPKERL